MAAREHRYYVYIVASRTRVLYCGMTNSVIRRTAQHRGKVFPGFTEHYNCERLVYYECHQYVYNALDREKQIKRWSRAKKIELIERFNPTWGDLSEAWWKENGEG